jgi:hypothetical protein
MTTAAARVAGPRSSTAPRVVRVLARVHVWLAVCLAGYSALWITTLQSSEEQIDRLGVTRLEIKLLYFSLAMVIVLAITGSRLVRASGAGRLRGAAVAVQALAVANAVWQASMVYQPWIIEFVVLPSVIGILLLVTGRRQV